MRRGLSALVVKHEEYRFLIDCGEGTQRQILRAGVGFKRLNQIFLTHGHLDHILGLAGLISTYLRWEAMDAVEIYAAPQTLDRVHDLIFGVVLRGTTPPIPISLLEIKPGVFYETSKFNIRAFRVEHRGSDSLGFRFEEHARRPFLAEKAEALQIPPGVWRRDLVNGKTVTLPDGRMIDPEAVLGAEKRGTHLVVVGDTGKPEALLDDVKDADALVIESTYLNEEQAMAREFGHATAAQVARLAVAANVRKLIVTHISRRYRDRDVIDQAVATFPNTVLARDFDTFQIKHDDQPDQHDDETPA